jgi:crotonobetainyl-CoA:carnitine CoA-transferase CaiB-like acyl-CoA transferase
MSAPGVPLEEAWVALGGEALGGGAPGSGAPGRSGKPMLELHGEGGLHPSPYDLDEIAVGAVAATLLAAAELAEARGGARPQPSLDRAHAALAFASERMLRTEHALPAGLAPLSRFARTSDGYIRLHANYPHHRAALLRALGDPPEERALETIRARTAEELESAIAAAGGAAAAVRGSREWLEHPQGRAAAELGLLDFEPGESETPPLVAPGRLPCSGLRVLDLTRVIAGPVGTRMLAALGAEVLRIDPPAMPELELHVLDGCVGKRSALLDARASTGRDTLERLLADADVLVQGYRPGALARLGLDAGALRERHPHLVTVTLSAWGETGPWAERRGFDSLVQAACGIARACGEEGEPGALPVQALDHASGYLIAAAALRGLTARALSRRAGHARLALTRTAAWVMRHAAPAASTARAGQIDPEDYRVTVSSPRGPLRCLRPPGSLDGKALEWPRGVSAPGSDPPRWQSV